MQLLGDKESETETHSTQASIYRTGPLATTRVKNSLKNNLPTNINCIIYKNIVNKGSKQSGGGQASISQRHLGRDVLTRICSEKKNKGLLLLLPDIRQETCRCPWWSG